MCFTSNRGTRTYTVRESITFENDGPGICTQLSVRVALFQDWDPYINVLSESLSPSTYEVFTDEFGNRFAEFTIFDIAKGTSVPMTCEWRIEVEDLSLDLDACDSSSIPSSARSFLSREIYIESNDAQIKATATSLSQGKDGPCEIVEAIYEYVTENITYAGYIPEVRGAAYCLRQSEWRLHRVRSAHDGPLSRRWHPGKGTRGSDQRHGR